MALCPDCGLDHHPEEAEAVAEVATAEVLADGAEGVAEEEADAAVRVAEIEGATAVELAKINAKVEAGWQEARVAELEGEVAGMREVLGRLTEPPPAPEPEPVEVVEETPAEPAPPEEAPVETPTPEKKKSKGWWG